jgi:hypothetical protein
MGKRQSLILPRSLRVQFPISPVAVSLNDFLGKIIAVSGLTYHDHENQFSGRVIKNRPQRELRLWFLHEGTSLLTLDGDVGLTIGA